MKRFLVLPLAWSLVLQGKAATTIDASNHYAYGANLGWMDWRGDTTNGAVPGEYVCSGYLYAANVGWINLGSGSPANGIRYQNNSAADFGVNHDGAGNLSGYAYGANIGWIAFATNGAPQINLVTGNLSGSIYSANCGWISLSNTVAHVQTDSLYPGPLDTNGLPIPWELSNFGTTGVNPNADPDHDGMSNLQEYYAGTDPNNGNSNLRITVYQYEPNNAVTWSSVPTRLYNVQQTTNLTTQTWVDSGLGLISPDGAFTTRSVALTNSPTEFYRIRAVLTLP